MVKPLAIGFWTFLSVFCLGVCCHAQPDDRSEGDSDMKSVCVAWLKVTFLASGKIGDVTPIRDKSTCSDDSLITQASESARKITFTPQRVGGEAADVIKQIEYTFSVAYEENSPEISTNAEVTRLPKPKFPRSPSEGKVKATLTLRANGSVEIQEITTDLPQGFKDAVIDSVRKIKFSPAIRKADGHLVAQTKTVIYEVSAEKE